MSAGPKAVLHSSVSLLGQFQYVSNAHIKYFTSYHCSILEEKTEAHYDRSHRSKQPQVNNWLGAASS